MKAWILIAAVLLVGCGRQSVPVITRNDSIQKIVIREQVHDTLLWLVQDSSAIQYLIDCEGDKARLTQMLHYEQGRQVQPPRVIIRENILTAECLIDSQAVFFAWKTRDTTNVTKIEQVQTVEVNRPTGWQWFWIWAGRILLLIVIAYVIKKLYFRK